MTKSRTALHVVAPLLFCWADAVPAEPGPAISAEELLAAYNARVHEAMGNVDGVRRCPRDDGSADAIVVCGRNHDASMRLPLPVEQEPGTRRRLVAGEVPSASDVVNVGRACCASGPGINLLGLGAALARGLGNVLHPN